jgi:preprotein translocase subunit YajC
MPLILIPLLLFAMYFLLLRPQQQRVRKQQQLISTIGVGDRVVTAGGMYGRVVELTDERLQLEVAEGVVVEFLRLAINRRLDDSEPGVAWATGGEDDEEYDEEADGETVGDESADDESADDESADDESAGDGGAVEGDEQDDAESERVAELESDAAGAEMDHQEPIQEAAAPAPGQDPH